MATTTLVPMPPLAPREVSERAATPRRIIVEESSLANGNAGAMPVVVSQQQQQQQQQQWAFDVLGDYGEYLDGLRREGGGDEDESTGAGVDAEVDGGNKSPTVGRLDVGALPEDIAFAAEQLGSRDPAMSSLIINTYRRKKLEREAIHEYASNVKETTTLRDESGTIGGGRGAPSPSVYLIKNGSSATTTGAGVGAAAAAGVGGGMEMSASHRQESALDTYLDMRQERALRRWEHYCELWERERKKLHANLDLPSEHPYIMDSADEYRKKIETLDALDRAVPLEERHGSDQWTMSLRNNWARYVPVGNIFSGLFCPVEERQRGFDDLIKVGKPKSSATAASDPQRVRGWHQSSHLALRLMQFSKRVEGFPKYNPDMTQLEVQGRGVVEELLDLADKQITLEEIEAEVRASNEDVWMAMKEARRKREANAAAKAVVHDAMVSTSVANIDSSAGAGSEGGGYAAAARGPNISISSNHVSLFGELNRNCTSTIFVTNTGSTAVYYEWARMKHVLPRTSDTLLVTSQRSGNTEVGDEKNDTDVKDANAPVATTSSSLDNLPAARGADEAEKHIRFFFTAPTGCILPGRTQLCTVTFRSPTPGMFEEEWAFCTSPRSIVASGSNVVVVRGVCSPAVSAVAVGERAGSSGSMMMIDRMLSERVKMRQVALALDSILSNVMSEAAKAAEEARATTINIDDDDDLVLTFDASNGEQTNSTRLFYDASSYEKLKGIYSSLMKENGDAMDETEGAGDENGSSDVVVSQITNETVSQARGPDTSDEATESGAPDGEQLVTNRAPGSTLEWDGSVARLRAVAEKLAPDTMNSIDVVESAMMLPSSRRAIILVAMREALNATVLNLCDGIDAVAADLDSNVSPVDGVDGEGEEDAEKSVNDTNTNNAESEANNDETASPPDAGVDSGSAVSPKTSDDPEEIASADEIDPPASVPSTRERRSEEALGTICKTVRPIVEALATTFVDSEEKVTASVMEVIEGRLASFHTSMETSNGGDNELSSDLTWKIFDLLRKKSRLGLP